MPDAPRRTQTTRRFHIGVCPLIPRPLIPRAIDKQIAAIALIHDLTVVTRNTSDFGWRGVRWINPFS